MLQYISRIRHDIHACLVGLSVCEEIGAFGFFYTFVKDPFRQIFLLFEFVLIRSIADFFFSFLTKRFFRKIVCLVKGKSFVQHNRSSIKILCQINVGQLASGYLGWVFNTNVYKHFLNHQLTIKFVNDLYKLFVHSLSEPKYKRSLTI